MRFEFSTQGDPVEIMLAEVARAERAVSRGTRRAGEGLKRDWRNEVKRAGLGNRLANTVRARSFPQGQSSINAASLVYSRAPDILDAHDRGSLIRSSSGFYLAIPIAPDVQKMRAPGNKRITPAGWERKTGRRLRYVYRPGKHALLVDDGSKTYRSWSDPLDFNAKRRSKQRRARKTMPIFVLVPFAKLRQKMDLDRASDAWATRLPGLILDGWKGGTGG